MGLLDRINRLMASIGGVLSGEYSERQQTVTDALRREYDAAIEAKDAEIAELSEKLDEALRVAGTRLEKIHALENPDAKREPVPPIKTPVTNGGRIRAASDRELAKLLYGINGAERTVDDWRQWLGEEAEK